MEHGREHTGAKSLPALVNHLDYTSLREMFWKSFHTNTAILKFYKVKRWKQRTNILDISTKAGS